MNVMDLIMGFGQPRGSVTDIPKTMPPGQLAPEQFGGRAEIPAAPSMPTENIGEVGANPFGSSPGANPFSSPGANQGPTTSPLTFNELFSLDAPKPPAVAQPGGGAPAPAPSAQASSANAGAIGSRSDGRDMLRDTARALILNGSPAQKVQGIQMMFEANQPTPDERAETERQRAAAEKKRLQEEQLAATLAIIDEAPASEQDKAMARTQARARILLGDQAKEVMDSLGVTQEAKNKRQTDAQSRNDKLSAWQMSGTANAQTTGAAEVAAQDAIDLIDKGTMTTGLAGYVGQMVPGSDAKALMTALAPLQAIIGFDRLQQMREASKTGGALGSVSNVELGFLQASQGSLDPVNTPPDRLKANIATVIAGKRILNELHDLVPAMDAGDPAAHAKARELSKQMGALGMRIRQEERLNAQQSAADAKANREPVGNAPIAGARQASDGNWYLERNGQYYRVEQ